MIPLITPDAASDPRAVTPIRAENLKAALADAPPRAVGAAKAADFKAKPGEHLLVTDDAGRIEQVLFGLGDGRDPFVFGAAPMRLPEGDYRLARVPKVAAPDLIALSWALGAYQFDAFKKASRKPARLVWPDGADVADVTRIATAVAQARDLINTPAQQMGPRGLEDAASQVAESCAADTRVFVGDTLVQQNFPMIHAVGRAAGEDPRLIEIEWGASDHPRVAIVGKGVTFDSGGLGIKPSDGMRMMKKDMGGAAHALALARMVMEAGLKLRLHLLIPAVENAIGAGAFRPGDILKSRAGKTVEVEHTDAEGRLVLADALTRAGERKPELIIDFATLTGAARVALGPEIAPFYTNDDDVAARLETAAGAVADPVWRMPLWPGYDAKLDGSISDLRSLWPGPFAGSIVAALFLQRFVEETSWLHFDVFAWNPEDRPGRPKGGEAQGLRAAFEVLKAKYAP